MPAIEEATILAVVVCDDVRRENNGKEIIIGVYGSDIVVQSYPALLSPTFWVQFIPNQAGEITIGFRLINEADTAFFSGIGKLNVISPEELTSTAIGGAPIQAQSDMKLRFQIKVGGSDWTTMREVQVRRAQPSEV
jgi:hypothetical protein